MITESKTEIDSANILGVLEERLGDFSQLEADYDTVILPVYIKPDGDLLSPSTAYIKGLIKKRGLKPAIAKNDSYKYVGQYSAEAIYPQLLILKDSAVTVILAILANYIYDNFIKSHTSDENIKITYTKYDISKKKFFKKTIEGPAKDVVELLNGHKEK
jgi:hypothetical protein